MAPAHKIRVRFAVETDEQAVKISALLEALGYDPERQLDRGSAQIRLRWAVSRLSTEARLTEREREVLALVLEGQVNAEISETLEISKATVKWHMHNILTKSGAATREALLRQALQLGGSARRTIRGGEVSELVEIEIEDDLVDDDHDDDEIDIEIDVD